MTLEIALWVFAVLVPAGIAWAIAVTTMLSKIHTHTKDLVEKHNDPAKHGLGPGEYADVVKENTRALRSHTHYLKWFIKEQIGQSPPPPIEGGATGIIEGS